MRLGLGEIDQNGGEVGLVISISISEVSPSFYLTDEGEQQVPQVGLQFDRSIEANRQTANLDLNTRLDRSRQFMDKNLSRSISLDVLADEASLSKYHYSRLFKATFGMAPMKYLQRKKLEEAHRLLLSGLRVNEVAVKLGFKDVSYFSNRFKKHFGIRPSQLYKGK